MRAHVQDGQEPYPGMSNNDVVNGILKGFRSPQPKGCPEGMYTGVMCTCWLADPASRPSFKQLAQALSASLQSNTFPPQVSPTYVEVGLKRGVQGVQGVQGVPNDRMSYSGQYTRTADVAGEHTAIIYQRVSESAGAGQQYGKLLEHADGKFTLAPRDTLPGDGSQSPQHHTFRKRELKRPAPLAKESITAPHNAQRSDSTQFSSPTAAGTGFEDESPPPSATGITSLTLADLTPTSFSPLPGIRTPRWSALGALLQPASGHGSLNLITNGTHCAVRSTNFTNFPSGSASTAFSISDLQCVHCAAIARVYSRCFCCRRRVLSTLSMAAPRLFVFDSVPCKETCLNQLCVCFFCGIFVFVFAFCVLPATRDTDYVDFGARQPTGERTPPLFDSLPPMPVARSSLQRGVVGVGNPRAPHASTAFTTDV